MKRLKVFLIIFVFTHLIVFCSGCQTQTLTNDCTNEQIPIRVDWMDNINTITFKIKPVGPISQVGESCNYGVMISDDYIVSTGFFTNSLFHSQKIYYAFKYYASREYLCEVTVNLSNHLSIWMTELKFVLFRIERSILISKLHDNCI